MTVQVNVTIHHFFVVLFVILHEVASSLEPLPSQQAPLSLEGLKRMTDVDTLFWKVNGKTVVYDQLQLVPKRNLVQDNKSRNNSV